MSRVNINIHPRFFALARNAGIVLSGNALSSVIALVYLAVLTRAISIEQFGLYSLYGAFVEIISRLTSFQTWQGLIHYGAHAKENDDKLLLYSLLSFGWILDLTAGLLGFTIAIGLAVWVPKWFGLPTGDILPAVIAASILLFNWTSAPTALLRIYDRYFPQALYQNITAALQLICVTVLWLVGETRLVVYLAVTSANNIIGQLWFFWYASKIAAREGILKPELPDIRHLPEKCHGIWRYVMITNLDAVVRVARDLDIFLVNSLIDVRAAGLYKIVRTLTSAMGKVTGPFYQTIYPELARLAATNNPQSMLQLMKHSAIALGCATSFIWIGFIFLGRPFLELAFGPEYVNAYSTAVWCIAAMVIWGFAQPLSPAMMAIRRPGVSLIVHIVTTAIYIGLLLLLVPRFDLPGAGMAMFYFFLIWSLIMTGVVMKFINLKK